MLQEFKLLVDSTIPSINSRDKYGYPITTNETYESGAIHPRTIDPIITKITELLKPINENDKIPHKTLTSFQKEMVYRYVLYQEAYENYMPIVKTLFDSQRNLVSSGLKPLSNEKEWKEAITLIKELLISGSYSFTKIKESELRNSFPKEYDAATSVCTLMKKYSWVVKIDNQGDIHIENGIENTTNAIEKLIKKIGGITLAEFIFDFLQQNNFFNEFAKRYLIGRTTTMLALDRKPDEPIGYLLNLAVKYPYRTNFSNSHKILNEIFITSTLLCNALFQAQHYSIWEIIYGGGDRLIPLVRDISVYDTIFSFSQGDIDSERKILNEILKFIPEEKFIYCCGFSSKSFYSLLAEVAETLHHEHKPVVLYKSVLNKKLQLQKKELDTLMEVLSHEPDEVNSKYELPSEYSTVNFWKKPFIKINSNSFLLMNKTWCAKSFYESIAVKLRSIPNFDSKIGYSIEDFLKNRCNQKGITYSFGQYKEDGIEGECDMIIETEDTIVLFEIKKKVLTGRAKSGNDIDIIIDLNQSLMDSQIQASRTELLLLKNKKIALQDKQSNSDYILNLNNRKIEKVSITHLDFRGFHDRVFIKNLLETFLTHELNTYSSDPKIINKFEEIKSNAAKLQEQYNEYFNYNPNHNHAPFFNSSFLNVDHLILLIELSDNNKSFLKLLSSTNHVNSTGSLNFYREFCNAIDLRKLSTS